MHRLPPHALHAARSFGFGARACPSRATPPPPRRVIARCGCCRPTHLYVHLFTKTKLHHLLFCTRWLLRITTFCTRTAAVLFFAYAHLPTRTAPLRAAHISVAVDVYQRFPAHPHTTGAPHAFPHTRAPTFPSWVALYRRYRYTPADICTALRQPRAWAAYTPTLTLSAHTPPHFPTAFTLPTRCGRTPTPGLDIRYTARRFSHLSITRLPFYSFYQHSSSSLRAFYRFTCANANIVAPPVARTGLTFACGQDIARRATRHMPHAPRYARTDAALRGGHLRCRAQFGSGSSCRVSTSVHYYWRRGADSLFLLETYYT